MQKSILLKIVAKNRQYWKVTQVRSVVHLSEAYKSNNGKIVQFPKCDLISYSTNQNPFLYGMHMINDDYYSSLT